jgi:23S rRNA (uracil1939-C5)-methyltransferase
VFPWHNQSLQLTIDKLVYGGDGLARLPADDRGPGKAVFVPFVLPGETVEAELTDQHPGFARAQLKTIVTASPLRIVGNCPYFTACGGCHYQHAPYEEQLEIKVAILRENLRRIAKLELQADIQVHASPPWNYRNRTRLGLRPEGEFVLGYRGFASETLLAVEQCPISSPLINRAIQAMWEAGRAGRVNATIREIEFFANPDDSQLMVTLYVAHDSLRDVDVLCPLIEFLRERVPAIETVASTSERSLIPSEQMKSWGHTSIVGPGSLKYEVDGGSLRVTAGAFFQTNRHMVPTLTSLVAEGRRGGVALDFYAGVGLFSVTLAREFDHVVAVEASPTSFADLRYNAPAKVKAARGTVQDFLENGGKKHRPDLIVVDPPRAGLGERVAKALAGKQSPHIIYVSCDPATLARDLRVIVAAGYSVRQVSLVDMFPQTYHLESVVELAR